MKERTGIIIRTVIIATFLLSSAFFVFGTNTVFAAQEGDYTYTTDDSQTVATITGYTGAGGAITIPSTLGEYPVVEIGNSAFESISSLTSVTIPNSVTSIEVGAFAVCTSLTSVTFGSGLTSIGHHAFGSCTGLTSVTIPRSVTTIANSAFSGCTALTSVGIESGLQYIAGMMFYSCTSLTSVTIPNSVTSIGEAAFSECTSLTYLTIPDSVTTFGQGAFSACTSLISVTLGSGLLAIGYGAFSGCTSLTSVTIPDSVMSIDIDAFRSCTGLTSVTIPDSVMSIESNAFLSCTSLTSISFLGSTAPTSVGSGWIDSTPIGIRGHAYAASDFPGPGGIWNGLRMGEVIPVEPGAPTGLVATSGNAQAILNWTAPGSTGGSVISGYKIYRGTSSGGETLLITLGNVLTYTNTGLTNGLTYYYKVSAVNSIGEGPKSNGIHATSIAPATLPSAPTLISATPSSNKVTLTWIVPSSNGGSAIDYYVIYQNGTEVRQTTSMSLIATGLVNGVSYSFNVAAHNAVGTGPQSSRISATPTTLTTILTVPDPPTGLRATLGNAQVSLAWTTPSGDGGATIDYYIVYQNGTDVKHTTGTSILITGLTNGQTYGFTVAAHNSVGIGAQSSPATATPSHPSTVPGAPTGIGAIPGNGQVSLSWIAPTNNGGATIEYYLVYVNGIVMSDHYPTTSTTITGLINDQQYSFAIVAHNSVGASEQSTAIASTPFMVAEVPGVPTGLTATPGNGQMTLSWAAPTTNGGVVIDYYIVYQDGIDISHPMAFSETIYNLTNGQSYNYTVAAHNSVGTGIQTSVITALPTLGANVPGIPTGLITTADNGKVILSWMAPAGSTDIDYYVVYQNGVDVRHTSETSTTIAGLTNGESYSFAVAAHGLGGVGPRSSTQTISPSATSSNNGASPSPGNDSMAYLSALLAISLVAIIAAFFYLRRNQKKE